MAQKWQITKNIIDMDYQLELQKYQVVLASTYAIPLTILGIFLQIGFNENNFFFGSITALVIHWLLKQKEEKIKKELEKHKNKATKIKN